MLIKFSYPDLCNSLSNLYFLEYCVRPNKGSIDFEKKLWVQSLTENIADPDLLASHEGS